MLSTKLECGVAQQACIARRPLVTGVHDVQSSPNIVFHEQEAAADMAAMAPAHVPEGLPYLLCFAAAGLQLQLYAVSIFVYAVNA